MSTTDGLPGRSDRPIDRISPSTSAVTGAGGQPALLVVCAIAAVLLTGCADLPKIPAGEITLMSPPQPASTPPVPPAQPIPAPALALAAEICAADPGEPTLRMLAYAERLRQLQPAELTQEIARLGDVKTPPEQLQLSLALSQLRQLPELVKAQELLARVISNPGGAALHPLARLLASRYTELRRFEEQINQQAQQIRDTQRRLDQTNERLEALKAIERSLVNRQPPAPPARAPATSAAPAPAASRGRSVP